MNEIKFGTDGIRGVAGVDITPDMVYQVSAATAVAVMDREGLAVVGHDPRLTSPEYAKAAAQGLADQGVDVFHAGMLTTPGIAYATELTGAQAGVVISASHNDRYQNGIKIIGVGGGKLSDDAEASIARLASGRLQPAGQRGKVFERSDLTDYYVRHLVDTADVSLSGLRVVIDAAHGAAAGVARRVYEALGAKVTAIFDTPDGRFINEDNGATHTAVMLREVIASGADLGVAHDGDADRAILGVAEHSGGGVWEGREVDGDDMLYIIARQHRLSGLVATVMTNLGIEASLQAHGIAMERVSVGDRYVAEGMARTGYPLGGENSGHLIDRILRESTGNRPYLAMGDGIHTSLLTVRSVQESGRTLAEWRREVAAVRYPQRLTTIPVSNKEQVQAHPRVKEMEAAATAALGSNGRVVLRPSGTEQAFRVMVEARDGADVERYTRLFSVTIGELFGS